MILGENRIGTIADLLNRRKTEFDLVRQRNEVPLGTITYFGDANGIAEEEVLIPAPWALVFRSKRRSSDFSQPPERRIGASISAEQLNRLGATA